MRGFNRNDPVGLPFASTGQRGQQMSLMMPAPVVELFLDIATALIHRPSQGQVQGIGRMVLDTEQRQQSVEGLAAREGTRSRAIARFQ